MELWEEIAADQYGGMNIFTGTVLEGEMEAPQLLVGTQTEAQQANSQNAEAVERRTGPPEGKTSIDPSFAWRVSEWDRAGRPEGELFILGSTGSVLQGLGAIESDIFMKGDKINTILQEHPEMTIWEIRHLAEILDDPVLVMKSRGGNRKGQNTRLTIYGSVRAQNGQPVMTVLDLRPVDGKLVIEDMQKVNSAYTRDNAANYVQGSEILYADKKRTTPLLRTIGLHGPIELQQSGSMGSISYKGQNVNIEGVPFSEVVKETAGKTSQEPGEYVKTLRALEKENQQLRERVDYLTGQFRLSGGPTVDSQAVRAEAGKLIKSLGVKGLTTDAVAQRMQNIYDLITTGRLDGHKLRSGGGMEIM